MKTKDMSAIAFMAAMLASNPSIVRAQDANADNVLLVKIAHVTPLSNRYMRDIAQESINAAALAVADLNARGLMANGKKLRFQSIDMDDAASAATAVEVAQRICKGSFAGVVGHLNSGTTIKAAPYYEQCAIPHITVAATNPVITASGHKTSYRLVGHDADLGQLLGFVATSDSKTRRIAVLHDRTFYGELIATNFMKGVTRSGGQILWSDSIAEYAPGPTTVVQRLKDTGVELLFYGGMDGVAGKFLKEMAYQKVDNVALMGGDGICSDQLPTLAGSAEAASAVLCGEGGAPVERMPKGAAFAARYHSEFQKLVKTYAAQTYDAFMALAAAMELANSIDPSGYQEFLGKVTFDGISGQIAFDAKGDLSNPVFTVFKYQEGKKVVKQLYHLSDIR
ncbi:branched-chain amino acid ABC transporter substrate-binding protein [Curvibacter sp. APW13]|uniref:branched-chain amino acid ABC transporter substrate-binding protein n=1 Tax=Curvibacter sp. APW13 TaxID=3077236 RepID=UPI0028E017C9|nr:branched-chain amino acid ABC transporter substrate-binding protein [Curvibacter sp. APW13]MDT8991705.1 branched-chain amino acid ABC transporter substrate-binding protein [Curvibacter sp. APW13]